MVSVLHTGGLAAARTANDVRALAQTDIDLYNNANPFNGTGMLN